MPRYTFPALIHALSSQVGLITVTPAAGLKPVAGALPAVLQTPLEKFFPHILNAIQAMWGYPELNVYLTKLTLDNRGGREGFPPEVWEDLYLLMRLHHDVFPALAT